ncbi:TPA: hypothetical protein QC364_000774 [Bacillus cereus]|uniref:hypothetical protein n=1 Tax=Bacillus paranthracis TaxID=2026186 RepID=UPI002D78132C|nr:hypothetical protein [Bacillus paranthracis]HDR8453982.1 hypothetical protein [Bacillus cereus]
MKSTNKKQKLKLRPWVKVVMLFVVGVAITTKIFSVMNTSASTEEPQNKIYHGVVRLDKDGKYELSMLDGMYKKEIKVDKKKDYELGGIVSVVTDGDKVVNDYSCKGKELYGVVGKYKFEIDSVRRDVKAQVE